MSIYQHDALDDDGLSCKTFAESRRVFFLGENRLVHNRIWVFVAFEDRNVLANTDYSNYIFHKFNCQFLSQTWVSLCDNPQNNCTKLVLCEMFFLCSRGKRLKKVFQVCFYLSAILISSFWMDSKPSNPTLRFLLSFEFMKEIIRPMALRNIFSILYN